MPDSGRRAPFDSEDEPPRKGRWASTPPPKGREDRLRQRARELRTDATATERLLWTHLRRKAQSGWKFRRQHLIGRYIVDFYCAEARLVIELDGPVHQAQEEYDDTRQAELEALGLTVLRFSNEEVRREVDQVLQTIASALITAANR